MIEKEQLNKIKAVAEEFFVKMTIPASNIEVVLSSEKKEQIKNQPENNPDVIDLDIELGEPQILIGQGGQTLLEIQRLLRMVLNKKLQKVFYLNLDINSYKKKKVEYLKNIAKELADQVSLNKEEKKLPPMSAYERRVIHAELAQRTDVVTESQGEGFDRYIIIKSK